MKLLNLIPLKEKHGSWKRWSVATMHPGRKMDSGIPKAYVKYLAVLKKIRELEDKQKEMGDKYYSEKDPKKRQVMMPALKKGTQQLISYRKNLISLEDDFLNTLDSPEEYD